MSSPLPIPAAVSADASEKERWFKREVHAHDGQLKAWLRGTFPAVNDVEDVVQESYLRIWRAKTGQPIASAKAFLFRVARHVALDLIRRARRSPVDRVGNLEELGVLEDGLAADEAALLQEKIDLLSDAIAALPDRRREVVILCKLQRFSAQEAADRLGLSRRAVEGLLARGVRDCEDYLRARGVHSFTDHGPR